MDGSREQSPGSRREFDSSSPHPELSGAGRRGRVWVTRSPNLGKAGFSAQCASEEFILKRQFGLAFVAREPTPWLWLQISHDVLVEKQEL